MSANISNRSPSYPELADRGDPVSTTQQQHEPVNHRRVHTCGRS
jgi:hypothetical protein